MYFEIPEADNRTFFTYFNGDPVDPSDGHSVTFVNSIDIALSWFNDIYYLGRGVRNLGSQFQYYGKKLYYRSLDSWIEVCSAFYYCL